MKPKAREPARREQDSENLVIVDEAPWGELQELLSSPPSLPPAMVNPALEFPRCSSQLSDDFDATALSIQGILEARRRSRQIHVSWEMNRGREHFHPKNIQVVPVSELSDQRSEPAKAHEAYVLREFHQRTRRPFTVVWRQRHEWGAQNSTIT